MEKRIGLPPECGVLALLFGLFFSHGIEAATEGEIAKSTLSVVALRGTDGVRSGVVTATEIVVSTCPLSDVHEPYSARIGEQTWSAKLQYADVERDLCQYEVKGLSAPSAARGSAKKLKTKNKVSIVGVSETGNITVTSTSISALRPFEESNYIQLKSPVLPTQAGAGLFNNQGKLVGIVKFYLPDADLNFALPIEWVADIPNRAAGDYKFVFTEGLPSRIKWMNRAIVLEKKSDWRGLEKHAKLWTKKDPRDRWGWLSLATAYIHLGQYHKAIPAYEAALRLRPHYAVAWNNLGTAYQQIGSYQRAVWAHEAATKLDQKSASAWFNLGTALYHQKNYKAASLAYMNASKLAPENAAIWYNLGLSYAEAGKTEAAIEAYRVALKITPEHKNAQHNLELLEKGEGALPRPSSN